MKPYRDLIEFGDRTVDWDFEYPKKDDFSNIISTTKLKTLRLTICKHKERDELVGIKLQFTNNIETPWFGIDSLENKDLEED